MSKLGNRLRLKILLPVLLVASGGCYAPNKVQITPKLPPVKIAVVRPPMTANAGTSNRISENALDRFYERVRTQIESEHKYHYAEIRSPTMEIAGENPKATDPASAKAALETSGADYLFLPVIVFGKDLAIGGQMAVDGFLFDRAGRIYWSASGAAKGADPASLGSSISGGLPGMLIGFTVRAATDPNAFARNAGMSVMRAFPAHLGIRAADQAGVSLPYVDRKGNPVERISAPALRLLDDVHLGAGDGMVNKLVVPAQVLIPFKKDRKGTHYAAHFAYLWNTGTGFSEGRTERWGGLILTDGKDSPGWAWFGTENARFKLPPETRYEFIAR